MNRKISLAAVLSIASIIGCGILTNNVYGAPGTPKAKVPDNVFEVGATDNRECILFADGKEDDGDWEKKLYLLNDKGFIDLDYTYLVKYTCDVQAKLYDLDNDGDKELVLSTDRLGGMGTHIESIAVIESPFNDKVKLCEYTTTTPDEYYAENCPEPVFLNDMLYKAVTFKADPKDVYTIEAYNSKLGNHIETLHFSKMKEVGDEKPSILLGNVAKYELNDDGIYLHTAVQNQYTFLPEEETELVYLINYDNKGNISAQYVGSGKLDSTYTPNPVTEKNMTAYKAFKDYLNAPKIELNSGASISGKNKDDVTVSYMEIGKDDTPVLIVYTPNSTHLEGYSHLFQYINGKVTHIYSTDEFDKVYAESGIIAGRYNQVGTPFGSYDRTYHVLDDSGKLTLHTTAFLIDDEDGYLLKNDEPYVGSYYWGVPSNDNETNKGVFDSWVNRNPGNDSLISRISRISLSDFLEGKVNGLSDDSKNNSGKISNPVRSYNIIYPGSKTKNDKETAALVQNFLDMTEYSPTDIVMVNADDFEGNGKYGAFIFVGGNTPEKLDYSELYEYYGKMWYTNGSYCQRLEDLELGGWNRIDGTLKFDNKKYVFADSSSGTSTISMVWEVQNGKAMQSNISCLGYIDQLKSGDITILSKAYDNYLDYEDGMYIGATYKEYFFYYDEETSKITEYAGTLLAKEQINGIAGFDLVKQMESKNLIITTAYYHTNGFLTVNYMEPIEAGYRCGYIVYDCNQKTYVYIHDSEIQTSNEMPLDDDYELAGIYQSRLGYSEADFPYLSDNKTSAIEIVTDSRADFYATKRAIQITGHVKGTKDKITAVVIDDKTYFDGYDYDKFTYCKKGMTPLSWIYAMLYEDDSDYELGIYKLQITNGHVDEIISFETSIKDNKKPASDTDKQDNAKEEENKKAHELFEKYLTGKEAAFYADNKSSYICADEKDSRKISYTYYDLNSDQIDELLIKEWGYWLRVVKYDSDKLYSYEPFYSACTNCSVLENGLLLMVDASHANRVFYEVCYMRGNQGFKDTIWFMHYYPSKDDPTMDEYTAGDSDNGEGVTIRKTKYDEYERTYTGMIIDDELEWTTATVKYVK